ncbi:MAG: hypothetical protein CMP55_05210 [Flavobacteriales bacterium]|nr:hypothetical protein [Flavobacteriales bacterium]|tara:strand:+ start:424 stop:2445 length:2022 start_codon:yes stop_codon:yes gene_type:complete
MEQDPWIAPYSIKIMNDFLDQEYYSYLNNIIQTKHFYKATQGIGNSQIVQEQHKIRLDYTLDTRECGVIDKPLINKADCKCNLRERWRLLYYNGDDDKKAFRDAHTDWTSYSCHRRMSIIIGLSNPRDYEGGELVFPNNNLKYKIGKGCAVIFDAKLLHEVLPVTKGKRYVLQAFLFDETGWNLKKVKNGYNNFVLLENLEYAKHKINHKITETALESEVIKNNNWNVQDNLNAVHSKIPYYESNYIGTFIYYNDVYNELNKYDDKKYFTWHKPSHPSSKWKGRLYAWDEKTCLLNKRTNIASWPREKHTLSGIRKNTEENIFINIVENNDEDKFLSIISCDGGPGNQIEGIKEGLIMSKVLNREFIFPPIIQHYTLNRTYRRNDKEIKYWNFNEVFNYNNEKINNLVDNIQQIEDSNCIIQCTRQQDITEKLRMEKLFNDKCKKVRICKNRFSNENEMKILESSNKYLLISHLYNNLQISTCFWNGCDTCNINKQLIEPYKEVCSKFDYSDKIKQAGDKFIKENLGEQFISLHMRYQDYASGDIKQVNKLYNESDIKTLIDDLTKEHDMPVFIATNNQKKILQSELKECKMLQVNSENDELESFIEQYICSHSNTFIYSGGIHAKPNHTHLRSTWSSFVLDYRFCILNKKPTDNIYLSNYFSNNLQKYGYTV